jgi:hypothetical protein
MNSSRLLLLTAGITLLCAGCAAHRRLPETAHAGSSACPTPSRVRFDEFSGAQIKAVEYGNGRHLSDFEDLIARELNENLYYQLTRLLDPMETVPCGGEFRPAIRRTLLIEPRIVDMRLVDPIDRFWFTWAAGDSVIRLQLVIRDSATSEVIAQPIFERRAPLFFASADSGQSDRELPDLLAEDVSRYVRANR